MANNIKIIGNINSTDIISRYESKDTNLITSTKIQENAKTIRELYFFFIFFYHYISVNFNFKAKAKNQNTILFSNHFMSFYLSLFNFLFLIFNLTMIKIITYFKH